MVELFRCFGNQNTLLNNEWFFTLNKFYEFYLHKPLGPKISTEGECSFSRETLVSPPMTITNEVASVSIGQTSFSHKDISSAAPSHVPEINEFVEVA